jgi:hypothetical protein
VLKGSRFVPTLLLGLALLLFLSTGIEWSERVSQSGSPTFSPSGGDFADFDSLVDKLTPPHDTDHPHQGPYIWHHDHVSQFLWGELSNETRQALLSSSTLPPRKRRMELLARDLNRILESGYSIFSAERFPLDDQWLTGFSLTLMTATATTDLPTGPEYTIILARAPDSGALRFRVIERPAVSGDAVYLDYDESDLSNQPGALERLKAALETPEVAQHFDAARVPASTAAPLVKDLIDRLGYTGLGLEVDEEKRDQARRYRLEKDTDHQWLNRKLLESAYVDDMAQKLTLVDDTPNDTGLGDQYLREVRQYLAPASMKIARWVATDVPKLLVFQIKTVGVLALCALIPAIAGLIFRRAFWSWFLGAFSVLFLVNWTAHVMEWGGIGAELAGQLEISYGFYLWIEVLLVLVVLAFRLERHSAAMVDSRTRRNSIVLAVVLVLLTAAVVFSMWARAKVDPVSISVAAILALTARGILQQSLRPGRQGTLVGKNIVMCLDGTWNQPGTSDFGFLAETNVYKLFTLLKGTRARARTNARQCKEYLDAQQGVQQIAFYYHGVGNAVENSQIGQVLGGAFGMGADAIVERAYLDLVRVYRPGDRIFIFGFSRGAAIARLLANVVGRRDVPRSLWTLRIFGQHWLVWKSAQTVDATAPVKVEVLGCWDTVGAFGISKNILGIPFQRINLLHDLDLSLCVKRAYHMVALDETRDAFEPTLMDPDPTSPTRVIEVWFSGNHANVGGGYNTSQLSDITLDFLLRHVSSGYAWADGMEPGDESWGLYLSAARRGLNVSLAQGLTLLDPDACGQLRHATGAVYSHLSRTVPLRAVIHDSVFERMRHALPVYAPQSLFKLNEEIVRMRGEHQTQVTSLAETGSIDAGQFEEILVRGKKHLTLKKWSEYQGDPESTPVGVAAPNVRVNPADELPNLARAWYLNAGENRPTSARERRGV